MVNKDKVKNKIKDLMQQLYEAKGFNNLDCNPLERNMFEEEMKDLWENVETYIILYADEREKYEEEIEDLKERLEKAEYENIDLIDNNYLLAQENDKLREILNKISEAVNDTWS